MFPLGTLVLGIDKKIFMGAIIGEQDADGNYPMIKFSLSDTKNPPLEEFVINPLGVEPYRGSLSGNFHIDPWNIAKIPASEIPKDSEQRLDKANLDKIFRAIAKAAVKGQYAAVHARENFVAGQSAVPISGKIWGHEEMESLTDASMDFWLTTGRFNDQFEKNFSATVGCKYTLTVNSGSSANLIALSTLCSPKLGEKRLKPGDEVITVAAGFPTTVAPIVQYGLIPVFVDVTAPTYNAIPEQIAEAVSSKTRAIMIAHTLGNPFDIQAVLDLAKKHDLWVIEDACDALGSLYHLNGEDAPRMCGSFGHIATFSFYPAHHMTMGEGGAVVCNDTQLYRIAMSMRDWGRDCWCNPGQDDSCKRRYKHKFPLLPDGYDHKYVYSHLGYNLKITDMQAAVGLRQLDRLETFSNIRRRNFRQLNEILRPLAGDTLILPEATAESDPSWFGYLITLQPHINRTDLLEYLNAHKIGTRMLFAGNMKYQPCFENVKSRTIGDLSGTDTILKHTFWVGCYQGLSEAHMNYIGETVLKYFKV